MKIAVGFLTYNGASARYLGQFLPSLEKALAFLPSLEKIVYVLDNSDAGHEENYRQLHDFSDSRPVGAERLLFDIARSEKNLGFGRAYNILIKKAVQAGADYFLIINPDIILEEDMVSRLLASLEADPDLAVAAPKIRRWDFAAGLKTGFIDSCGLAVSPGLRFRDIGQGEPDQGQYDRAEIIGPSGAAGLFRVSALEKIAVAGCYFDERFFMYKEDCDLAYRLFRSGVRMRLVPEAVCYHDRTAVQNGRGLLARLAARRIKSRQVKIWSFHNQLIMFRKYWPIEKFKSRMIIVSEFGAMVIFSLIFERFLLKELWRESD